MERILVIDPGERVGWCHAEIRPDEWDPNRTPTVAVTGHGITPLKDFALKLHEVAGNYDTIVYETWRLYPQHAKALIGSDMQSSQMVGMIRLCAWLNPRVKLVGQGASAQKTGIKVAPPEIREILDRLPKSHDEAHDGSALAHLSYYWFKKYAG